MHIERQPPTTHPEVGYNVWPKLHQLLTWEKELDDRLSLSQIPLEIVFVAQFPVMRGALAYP